MHQTLLLHVANLPSQVLLTVILLKVQGFHLNDFHLSGSKVGNEMTSFWPDAYTVFNLRMFIYAYLFVDSLPCSGGGHSQTKPMLLQPDKSALRSRCQVPGIHLTEEVPTSKTSRRGLIPCEPTRLNVQSPRHSIFLLGPDSSAFVDRRLTCEATVRHESWDSPFPFPASLAQASPQLKLIMERAEELIL